MHFKNIYFACFLAFAFVHVLKASSCISGTACEEDFVGCNNKGNYYTGINRCDCTGTEYNDPDCLTKRGACQKSECVFGKCNVNAAGVQSCECDGPVAEVLKNNSYVRAVGDTACNTFTSNYAVNAVKIENIPKRHGQCRMGLTFLLNENCTVDSGLQNRSGCSNTIFKVYSYTNGSISTVPEIKTYEYEYAGYSLGNTIGVLFGSSFNLSLYESLLSADKTKITLPDAYCDDYGYNFTGMMIQPTITLTYTKCDQNACDGVVDSCSIQYDSNYYSVPSCVCGKGFEFSKLDATTPLPNVCKNTTVTVCQNKGEPYYKSLQDTRTIDCDCNGLTLYDGPTCNISKTPCDARPCQNGGKCIDDPLNSTQFSCECVTPFIGRFCEFAMVEFQNISSGTTNVSVAHLELQTLANVAFYFKGFDPLTKDDFFFKSDGSRRISLELKMLICENENSCVVKETKTQSSFNYRPSHLYNINFEVDNTLNETKKETVKFAINMVGLGGATAARRRETLPEWELNNTNTGNASQVFQYAIAKQTDNCPPDSCSSNGNCVIRFGGLTCDCDAGWTGQTCQNAVSEKDEDKMDWKIWGPVIGGIGAVGIFLLYWAIARPSCLPFSGSGYKIL